MCVDCRWRWTVSVTGKVYVQSAWRQSAPPEIGEQMARRLLGSIDGLTDKLGAPWPTSQQSAPARIDGFTAGDLARLRHIRDATSAGYFNEGVPLSKLRAEGIILPPDQAP